MNSALKKMLEKYRLESRDDYELALREIMQELALLGLWRSKFFEHAAFYGGTALRIMYKLDRYSEDLDFSLLRSDKKFNPEPYIRALKKELWSYGFEVDIRIKEKEPNSAIQSAFLKANTIRQYLTIEAGQNILEGIPANQIIKIKLEIDTDPPLQFETEPQLLADPISFSVRTYSLPDLFAGKMHAVLFREWKHRVKGRDWYDLIWYAVSHPKLHLEHLKERMIQSGHWERGAALTPEKFQEVYRNKIERLNIAEAKKDIAPFIRDSRSLETWSKDLFFSLFDRFVFV